MAEISIRAEGVATESRLDALPRHFGAGLMLTVERTVFRTLEELAPDYHGAYWHYYELSNGGFYMAPDLGPLRVRVPDAQFSDVVSADAAGIIACLFAYSRVASECQSEMLAEHYERLRDFAQSHEEETQILRAID